VETKQEDIISTFITAFLSLSVVRGGGRSGSLAKQQRKEKKGEFFSVKEKRFDPTRPLIYVCLELSFFCSLLFIGQVDPISLHCPFPILNYQHHDHHHHHQLPSVPCPQPSSVNPSLTSRQKVVVDTSLRSPLFLFPINPIRTGEGAGESGTGFMKTESGLGRRENLHFLQGPFPGSPTFLG